MTAIFAVIIVLFTSSCTNENIPISKVIKDKTIVFYIVADNNLYAESDSLILDLSSLLFSIENNNILVFVDDLKTPRLYYLDGGLHKICDYKEMNSLNPSNIRAILEKIKDEYPAKENGLVLWSHGTGWIHTDSNLSTRAFGIDQGSTLNTDELFDALPCYYDYIIFDACFMATIENIAEARNKCKLLLGSPEVVPSMGIMDKKALEILVRDTLLPNRLIELCNHYIEKYNSIKDNISISLSDTEKIKKLIQYVSNSCSINTSQIDISHTISYDFRFYKIFFDARDVFEKLGIPTLLLDDIILFSANGVNNTQIGCGLSIYLPTIQNNIYIDSYNMLNWEQETLWSEKCALK